MIYWVTIKKKKKNLMKRGKKRLNVKLECHMAEPHAFPHEVFSYIYIY